MRARAVLLGVAGLLAVLVACIWVVPGVLDWNRYREGIAALAASGIGRPVRIGGGVTLHLLPQPILTASGIEVDDAGDGLVLTAQELRLRVALGPLLGGRVDARELTLRGADLRLPWPPLPGALARRPPAWLTGLQARLEESRLQVGNLVLTGIDASLATDPDTGTLSTAGLATMGGRPWRFTARLARPGRDGAAGLDVSLDGQGPLRDTGGTFSGALAADGALSGRVAGRGPDLSQLMPSPAVAWRGDGRLSAAAGLAVADELALEIGGSPARGAVALRVQPQARLDLALAVGRLDLDAWLPALMQRAQPGVPSGLPTGIDLSAEAATLAGGTLRRLRGAFDLDADGFTVRDATALLPGDALLSLSGRVPGRARGPLFEGNARLAAPDLRNTLRWLEPLAPQVLGGLPADALRRAELSAKVVLEPAQTSLTDLRGTLDGGRLQGGVSVRMGPRLGISAGLSLDRLALDPWSPDADAVATPALAQAALVPALVRAAAFDAELTLQVRQATWRGAELGQLAVDAQSEAGRLTLRRLEATPLGIRITASGTLEKGGRVSEARLDVSTQDVSPLRAWAGPGWADLPGLLRGPGSALLILSGPPEALATRATLDLGDLRIEAQPVLNLPGRRWAGPVMLHHPGAPRLLELLGLPGTAAWLGDGSLSLLGHVTAAPGRTELENFDLAAGSMRAKGGLLLDGQAISGQVLAESLPLPMPYPRSPDPLPTLALHGKQAAIRLEAKQVLLGLTPVVQDVTADVAFREGGLRLGRVTAKLAGGALTGAATFDAGEPPRFTVQATATAIPLSGPLPGSALNVASGQLDAQLALSGEGHSPAALLATLSGSANALLRGGVLTGFDLAAIQAALASADRPVVADAVRAALLAGETPFTRLDLPLTIRRGVLSGEATIATEAGAATLSGNLDLLGGGVDARLAVRPGRDLPELVVRLSGPAAQPARMPELAGLARWLAERP